MSLKNKYHKAVLQELQRTKDVMSEPLEEKDILHLPRIVQKFLLRGI